MTREKLFDQRCNHESVEVLPVDGAYDLNWLRDILLEFVTKTGSELAQHLLDDWPASAKLFVKVCLGLGRIIKSQAFSDLEMVYLQVRKYIKFFSYTI